MGFDERLIDEVAAATDIVQLIGAYIPVKKAGANFKAICPFHQEKTPSFMISPQKQIFHCFGCGAGGNVYSFVMRHENMTFPEAVEFLARKAGITIPEKTPERREQQSQIRILTDLYQAAAGYYRSLYLDQQRGSVARAYMEGKRHFQPATMEQFGIGYATSDWRGLWEYLRKKDFPEDVLARSGLVGLSDKGAYDFFRDRVIFPIVNLKDKVIAFGGRTMGTDEPKYLNTPETELFRKRYELYGLNQARRAIAQWNNTVIIVEGYLDVVALHEAGVANAVAPLGTALSSEQVRLVRRYAEKAIMIFDGDEAGIKAALRSVDIFLAESFPAAVVVLPDGHDPDSFVKEKGYGLFVQTLDGAEDAFDFKMKQLVARYNVREAHGLMKLTQELLETLVQVPHAVLQDAYIKKCAARLGVQEAALRQEMAKLKRPGAYEEQAMHVEQPKVVHIEHTEELDILALLVTEPTLYQRCASLLTTDDFTEPVVRELFRLIGDVIAEGTSTCSCALLAHRVTTEDAKEVLSRLPFITIEEDSPEEALANRIREMKVRACEQERQALHQQITQAVAAGDHTALLQLQQVKMAKEKELQILKTKGVVQSV